MSSKGGAWQGSDVKLTKRGLRSEGGEFKNVVHPCHLVCVLTQSWAENLRIVNDFWQIGQVKKLGDAESDVPIAVAYLELVEYV